MGSHLGPILLLASGFVSSLAAEPDPAVIVRLYNYAGVSTKTIERAAVIAGSLFQRTGLTVKFLQCEAGGKEQSTCHDATGIVALRIRIIPSSPVHPPDTLGVSVIPGDGTPAVFAAVFAVHIMNDAGSKSLPASIGFAAVFAHEIYHLLTGETGHSALGLMCHQLGTAHLVALGQSRLRLNPDQVKRLHDAYRRRLRSAEGRSAVARRDDPADANRASAP